MTPMEFILRFTFTNPDLDTTIVGTINPAHLQTNLDILRQGPVPAGPLTKRLSGLAAAGSAPKAGSGMIDDRDQTGYRADPSDPQ